MRAGMVGIAVMLFSALAFSQAGVRGVPSYCSNNCGPYIPLISTPNVRFETVSPSPAGASNATGRLNAGARNSTLSIVNGNPDVKIILPNKTFVTPKLPDSSAIIEHPSGTKQLLDELGPKHCDHIERRSRHGRR